MDQGAGLGCVHRKAAEGATLVREVSTDEPGYPRIAQRWMGSDAARCVPQPHDAASLLPGALAGGDL